MTAFLLFSAFTEDKNDGKYLTRYELALMFEDVLNSAFNRNRVYDFKKFPDLTEKQNDACKLTTKLKIMSGFSDGTFRPDEKLRNVETISYIQRLAEVLFATDSELYAAKQLMRLFAYNVDVKPGDDIPEGLFPHKLLEPGEFSEKEVVLDIFNVLTRSNIVEYKNIEGCFMDSVTGCPIGKVFVTINGVAFAVPSHGRFAVSAPSKGNSIRLFAAAEGYEILDVKKDISFDRYLMLKMKPVNF